MIVFEPGLFAQIMSGVRRYEVARATQITNALDLSGVTFTIGVKILTSFDWVAFLILNSPF